MMIAVKSPKRSLLELSEIADLTFKEQLQTISGVSAVQIWGEKRYAMRLWLDPAKLAGYQMTPSMYATPSSAKTSSFRQAASKATPPS